MAEDLPAAAPGPYRLVTFGQSFHWTEEERVAEAVYDMLEPGGSLALVVHTGYFSLAISAPHLFPDEGEAFAREVRRLLTDRSPNGLFWDWPGDTELVLARKDPAATRPVIERCAGGRRRVTPIVENIRRETPGMPAASTRPLQSKFGPIVADAAGTITVQEASDVLECSRFRVCELLNPIAGRVLVTDVLALESLLPPSALDQAPAAKLVG